MTDAPRGPLDLRLFRRSPALWTHLWLCLALAALRAAAILVTAGAVGRYLPRMLDGDAASARSLCLRLVVVAAADAVAVGAVEVSSARAVIATRGALRDAVLDTAEAAGPLQAGRLGPARVAALVTSGMDALEPWIRAYLPALATAAVVPLAAGLRILGADVLSAVILAAVVPLIPLFMVLIGRVTEDRTRRQWATLQRLAGHFLDVLKGMPTLRMFGRADLQVGRVREVTERYRRAVMAQLRIAFLSAMVLELLATLSVAIVALALGSRMLSGQVTLSDALVVLLLAPECLLPMRRVGAAFHAAMAGADAAEEVEALLDEPDRATAAQPAPGGDRTIVLHAAGYDTPDREARLAPLDATFRPGTWTSLVGPSGVGKSTVIDLLRGRLAPTSGSITGVDAHRVAWIPQHPRAIGDTVTDSVRLGIPDLTDDEVERVLAEVGLSGRGDADPAALSGGERQRVALARAVARTRCGLATVVLADEPTAHLDDRNCALAAALLDDLAARGAVVVVATHDVRLDGRGRTITLEVAPDAGPAHLGADVSATPAVALPMLDHPEVVADPMPGFAAAGPLDPAPHLRRPTTRGWLRSVARPARARLAAGVALGAATELCTLGLAGVAAWLIVRASERPSFEALAVAAVAVRAFGIGKGVLRYAERLVSHDATLRLLADVRAAVVARLSRLSPAGLPRPRRGELVAQLTDDVDRLQDLFLRVVAPRASVLTASAVTVGIVVVLDPAAGAILALAVALVAVAVPVLSTKGARRDAPGLVAAKARMAGLVVDHVDHVEELFSAGAIHGSRVAITTTGADIDKLDRRRGIRTGALSASASAAAPLTVAATVAALAQSLADASGPSAPVIGVLVLLPLAVLEVAAPLVHTGEIAAAASASADRIVSLLSRPDPAPEPSAPEPVAAPFDVTLEHVAVRWPGDSAPGVAAPMVLDDVELDLPAGSTAVVRGPSGSGKSTLAAVLVGFLPPDAGSYRLGGVDAGAAGGESVRRHVTWCEQEPWFADTTLRENLRVAAPDASDQLLMEAVARVDLETWVRSLPDGLGTRLGRDAAGASGGQRHRLALARSVLSGHEVVVLDEPTAHLDRASADRVIDRLVRSSPRRSFLVITHDDLDLDAPTYVVDRGSIHRR